MAKAVRFNLLASVLVGAAGLVACAHPARELPPDMSKVAPSQRLLAGDAASPEFRLSCSDLQGELAKTRDSLSRVDVQLRHTQAENQSKSVAGLLLFTPIMLSMEDNEALKNRYRELDEHRERLVRIAQARQCAT